MPEQLIDDLISAEEAAKFLGVSVGTLAQWRHTKAYPLPFIKTATVRYRISDLNKFIAYRTFPGKDETPRAKRQYTRRAK